MLPPDVVRRSAAAEAIVLSPEEIDAAIWAQLLEDPAFELRLAAARPNAQQAPGAPLPGLAQPAQRLVKQLGDLPGRLRLPPDSGIAPQEIAVAATALLSRPVTAGGQPVAVAAAEAYGGVTDPEFVDAIARAIVAFVLAAHRADPLGTAPLATRKRDARDALVDAVREAFQPAAPRGVVGWLAGKVKEFAESRATSYIRDRRFNLTGLSLPGIGDVLAYQRRGADLLEAIAAGLDKCLPPVIAVGHSLGGIMLVDLLSRPNRPKADLLVTVGSQAPLLFMIDALGGLRPRMNPAATPFVPWLNIYDRSDFLSYCADRIFGKFKQIIDREISSGLPFPESHSAYWDQTELYDVIHEFWHGG